MWCCLVFVVGVAALAMPTIGFAESRTGGGSARAGLDFRIVIPAIIRVKAVTQHERIVIEDRHIDQGYIDLDAGTSVKLTVNTRDGYLLSASYDPQLLSGVEVRVSSQKLTASSGFGPQPRVPAARLRYVGQSIIWDRLMRPQDGSIVLCYPAIASLAMQTMSFWRVWRVAHHWQ